MKPVTLAHMKQERLEQAVSCWHRSHPRQRVPPDLFHAWLEAEREYLEAVERARERMNQDKQ